MADSIDYATPPPQKRRPRYLPVSAILALVQIPWFGLFVGMSLARMGSYKDMLVDSAIYLGGAMPALVAVGFATWECRRFQWNRRPLITNLMGVLAGILCALFVAYLALNWYQELWCDPHGRWSAP